MQHVEIISKNSDNIELGNLTIREIFLSCDEERSVLTIVYSEENEESKVLGRQCDFGLAQATRLQRSLKRLMSIFLSDKRNLLLDKSQFLEEVCSMFEREVFKVYE